MGIVHNYTGKFCIHMAETDTIVKNARIQKTESGETDGRSNGIYEEHRQEFPWSESS